MTAPRPTTQRDAAISQVHALIGDVEDVRLTGDGAQARLDPPAPRPPPTAAPGRNTPAVAATGAVGFLIALNEILRQHETTLDSLASQAGPIAGAVALAWPHLLGLFFFALWGHGKWRENQERSRKQSRDQLTALRLVATEVGHVGAEVGQVVGAVDALRADVTQLSTRVDASDHRTRTEAATFRHEVEERFKDFETRLAAAERLLLAHRDL